jgi:hypothetical protein
MELDLGVSRMWIGKLKGLKPPSVHLGRAREGGAGG